MASFVTRPGECSDSCQNAKQSILLRHAQEVSPCPRYVLVVASRLHRSPLQVVDVTLTYLASAPAKALGGLVVGGWSGGGMVGAKAAELFLQQGIQVHLVVFLSAVPDVNQVRAVAGALSMSGGSVCVCLQLPLSIPCWDWHDPADRYWAGPGGDARQASYFGGPNGWNVEWRTEHGCVAWRTFRVCLLFSWLSLSGLDT